MASIVQLPPPPKVPLQDKNGNISQEWYRWFLQLHIRVGGPLAVSNPNTSQASGQLASAYSATDDTVIYTSPSSVYTKVEAITVKNTCAADGTMSVKIVGSGQQSSQVAPYVNAQKIPAGQTVTLPAPPGGLIPGSASIVCSAVPGAKTTFPLGQPVGSNALIVIVTGQQLS